LSTESDGFYVRVSPTGRKWFEYRYRFEIAPQEYTRRRYVLGEYPVMSLGQARQKHREARALVGQGIDVALERKRARPNTSDALTVSDLADRYVEEYAKARKRSWKEDKRILHRNVVPLWGTKRVREVDRQDVFDLLHHCRKRGMKAGANRILAITRKMFNWAVEQGLLEEAPTRGVKSTEPEFSQRGVDPRILTDDEVSVFLKSLNHSSRFRPSRGFNARSHLSEKVRFAVR